MVELLAKMDTLLQKSNRTIKNLEDKLEQNSVVVKSEQMETNCTALAIAEDILNNANMMANNANIVTPNGLHTGVHTSTVTSSLTDLLTNNVTDVGLNGGLLNGGNPDMGFLEIQSLKKLEQAKKEEEIKRDENGLFLCPHCDTRMTYRHNLIAHIRVHTGERPFKCDFCPKRFSTPSSCKNHIKTHTGEKRFVCTVCDAKFARSGQLRCHIKKWHDGQGYSKLEDSSSVEKVGYFSEKVRKPSKYDKAIAALSGNSLLTPLTSNIPTTNENSLAGLTAFATASSGSTVSPDLTPVSGMKLLASLEDDLIHNVKNSEQTNVQTDMQTNGRTDENNRVEEIPNPMPNSFELFM